MSKLPSKVLVLDNGGYSAKVGYATDTVPKIIPNFITKVKNESRRIFVGNQLDDCKDCSGLFYVYPFGRGYIGNWEAQQRIWNYIFGPRIFNVDFRDTCLIVTEPYFNFISMQEAMIEIFLEDYKFHSIMRANSADLSAYHSLKDKPSELCCLVVDSGFSFTHIVPYVKGKKLRNATRRVNVGGKALTNYLKEIISYRQLNVMDETYVVNQIKEDMCYVSDEYWNDVKTCRLQGKKQNIVCDYVLPDFTVIKRGYVRSIEDSSKSKNTGEQFVRMNNERFQVPECLFNPSDLNIPEQGVSEAIDFCIQQTPEDVQPHLFKNIILTGGNTCFPGFRERVLKDVRSSTDCLYDVNVTLPEDPQTYAWEGGALLSQDPKFSELILTKRQFEEHGLSFALDKFDI